MTPSSLAIPVEGRQAELPPASLPVRRQRVLILLYLLAFVVFAQLIWSTVLALYGRKGADFLVIQEAGRSLLAGDHLYEVQRIARDLFGPNFHLPPFAALIVAPLALLDKDLALTVWRLLSLMAHFGALGLLLRTLGVGRWSPMAPLALALWSFSWPARGTFINGQWDGFFLLAAVAAWAAQRRGSDLLAGALLGLVGSLKPYPLLLLGASVARRRWRVWLGVALAIVCCAAVGYATAPRETLIFVQRVAPLLGATTALTENQSLAGFFARLFAPDMRPVATEAPLVQLVTQLALALTLLLPLMLLALRKPRSGSGFDLRYAAWAALVPIAIPVAWMHYQQLLLFPLTVLAAAWLGGPTRPGPIAWVLLVLATVLINFGDHYTVLGPLAGELFKPEQARVDAANELLLAQFSGPLLLVLSYKLYGALLLWVLCLVGAWRESAWATGLFGGLLGSKLRAVQPR